MSYKENVKIDLKEYRKLLEGYEKSLNEERYINAIVSAPFEFINALHICELLKVFNEKEKSHLMNFLSAIDAEMIYNKILKFKDKKDEVLDMADAIYSVGKKAIEINNLVSVNPYLPSSLKVNKDDYLIELSKSTLNAVKDYQSLLTKDFRDKFTESCIESLPSNELDILVDKSIIRAEHMNNIRKTGSHYYQERFNHLFVDVFGKEYSVIGVYEQSLKGVTFESAQNNRQVLLKNMKEAKEKGEEIKLEASIEEYKPELGPVEPSVPITWNKEVIGYLPRESAIQISELAKEKNIDLNVKLDKIVGGDNVYYGCHVLVEIKELVKNKNVFQDSDISINR